MMHVSCDLCGKDLLPGEDNRYVVKIEVVAAHDSGITEEDLDEDHMESLSQLLEDQEEGLLDIDEVAPARRNLRYDLCSSCHKRFIKDPLKREADHSFDFSPN